MNDDLANLLESVSGESPSPEFVATLRDRVTAEAQRHVSAQATEAQPILEVSLQPASRDGSMTRKRGILTGVAAAAIALVIGLAVLASGGDDPDTLDTVADAASCGLGQSAAISAAVDETGSVVTFEVTSDPACRGVDITISATPAIQGQPILSNATLDDAGRASVIDQLLGTRQGAQEWAVELIVSNTGDVAAVGGFAVNPVCDLEATAELEATYLPDTREVDIVFTVDPTCAGETITFDDDEIFASSPPGGWSVYTVDEAGRIEVTEQLVVPGPIISIDATPVAAERGIASGRVATVVLDIGS